MKKHYIELWLLLASAFVIFAVASAFDMPKIGNHTLKSSEIASVLFAERAEAPVLSDSMELLIDKMQAHVEEIFPLPTDTTSQRILFIGDSMLEGLSPRLAAYCEYNGHELYSVIWYSSTSEIWGKSDKLAKYIETFKPTYIIISLGANELFVGDIERKRRQYVEKIIDDIGDIPFIWIGPPNWKPDTGINRLVSSLAPKGCFFLSDGMHFNRAKDGAHPTRSSAVDWLDSIVRWMPLNARQPIRLEKPEKSTAKPKRVIVHQPSEK